ncbi:hypothetical protein WJX75_009454 [Coccomyxa subellipsoidea]|uniref:Uncharacterized protein n=1 Tax=Coccomyxa subellipsoidea TaxID=248742 RepID=A0ABR2Z1X2_9CHLO
MAYEIPDWSIPPPVPRGIPATAGTVPPRCTVPRKGPFPRRVNRKMSPSAAESTAEGTAAGNADTNQYTPFIGLLALCVIKSAGARG